MLLISHKFIQPSNQYIIIAYMSGYLVKIKPIRWHNLMTANKYIGLIKKNVRGILEFSIFFWVTWVNTLIAD